MGKGESVRERCLLERMKLNHFVSCKLSQRPVASNKSIAPVAFLTHLHGELSVHPFQSDVLFMLLLGWTKAQYLSFVNTRVLFVHWLSRIRSEIPQSEPMLNGMPMTVYVLLAAIKFIYENGPHGPY